MSDSLRPAVPRTAWLAVAAVTVAALVASVTGLGNGFALDDVLVIEQRALLHSLGDLHALLVSAYWQLPPEDTLWRPLGLLSFAAQWVAGGGAPMLFHALSIGLYVAASLAVLALAWQLLPPLGALAAGLVFAVHPVHVESVGNIVGQLELWVALAVVTAAALYVRARRRDALGFDTVLGILALAGLGLGFKEHAVLLPGFLVALEVTVLREAPRASDGGLRRRVLVVGLFAITALWLLVRADVVGGLAGDRPHVALKGLDATGRAWLMLGLVPELLRLFLWPARLYADYSPQYTALHAAPAPAHLLGAGIVVAYLLALVVAMRRDRALAMGLLWIAVAYSIVSNLLLPTGILLAERTLFLPSVGVAIALGALAVKVAPRVAVAAAVPRTLAVALSLGLIGVAAAHSAERQHAWKDNDTMMAALIADAPQNFRGYFWLGDQLLRGGDLVAGEAAMRRAMALWPEHDGPPLGLALKLQERGFCEPALLYYDIATRLEPRKPTPKFGRSSCLLSLGRLHDARSAAFDGLVSGRSAPAFRFLILAADSALAATDSVASNNWWLARQRQQARQLVP